MTNVRFPNIEDYRDIETLNMYKEGLKNEKDPEELMEIIFEKGQDNARTPMQWDNSPHADFTDGTPWIPVILIIKKSTWSKQCKIRILSCTITANSWNCATNTPSLCTEFETYIDFS